MKQFLRYQVSGTVFIIWIIIFYYGTSSSDLETLIRCIFNDMNTVKSLTGLISALPIGVIIHQISVLIKNCIISKFWKEFDDFPDYKIFIMSRNPSDFNKYIYDKISNLNSFYYVRFDNGLLAPLLAWLTIYFSIKAPINNIWMIASIIIGVILISYIPRIKNEIKVYNRLLLKSSNKKEMLEPKGGG